MSKRVRLRLTVPCLVPPLRGDRSPEQQREYTEEIEAKCLRTIADLEGFAVFDDSHRYEIRLPAGWRK